MPGIAGSRQRFSVLRGLWIYDLVRAEWQAAADLAEEMLALGRDRHNAGYELEGHRALGMTLLWRGLLVRAHDHLEQGRSLYDPEQHHVHAFRYGNDPGLRAWSMKPLCFGCLAIRTGR